MAGPIVSGRTAGLEALRAIACLVVFSHHCGLVFVSGGDDVNQFPYHGLLDPVFMLAYLSEISVLSFFVLSGYALTQQIRPGLSPGLFVVARIARLYPAFVASVCLAFVLKQLAVNGDWEIQTWWTKTQIWFMPTTTETIAFHILGSGIRSDLALNPSHWTIVQEIRISIIFPLILWFIVTWPARTALVVLLLFSWTSPDYQVEALRPDFSFLRSLIFTVNNATYFAAGVYIGRFRQGSELHRAGMTFSVLGLIAIVAISLVLRYNSQFTSSAVMAIPRYLSMFVVSTYLVVLCSSARMPAWAARTAIWGGRYTYSFYLCHLPIIVYVSMVVGKFGLFVAIPTAGMLTLFFTYVLYVFFDGPSCALARRLRVGATSHVRRRP